ncbi:MAG: phage/plasmid primase, P4 family, partial [Acidobacteriota bacterium]
KVEILPFEYFQFDTQPFLLNCANGTLDLKTGVLRPHNRADRITRIVNCNFDADAESETFERFLETIQPDPSIRAFLQRSIGYSLLGAVRERTFWILYGTGNNGKSIFVNLFNNLLGDYASATTTASVMAGKQNAIPNDIARLKGKRFVIIPETEENERLNSALVKALSAGDTVTARFLFGEYFDFPFTGKLWIATNHKPTITDHSKGMWDRMKLVPFTQDIPKDKIIKADDLMASLMADASAILNWAVLGCHDYFDLDGLDVPEVIQREIDAYRKEQDSISQFIEERCETFAQAQIERPQEYLVPADYRVLNSDLYKAYKEFCEQNGEYLRSHRRLTQNMHERGFKQLNSGGRYWEGVRLSDSS